MQRASGIPCSLIREGQTKMQTSGISCRENADVHQLIEMTLSGRSPYPGSQPRIAGRKKIAILIAKPMLHRIERSVERLPR